MYIDDCARGVVDIFNSNILEPINLGSSELDNQSTGGREGAVES
jgi:hypothetical protein